MAIAKNHDLHKRRFSQNVGVGLCLIAFVVVVFGLTLAKVQNGNAVEAFDHVVRPALVEDSSQ